MSLNYILYTCIFFVCAFICNVVSMSSGSAHKEIKIQYACLHFEVRYIIHEQVPLTTVVDDSEMDQWCNT